MTSSASPCESVVVVFMLSTAFLLTQVYINNILRLYRFWSFIFSSICGLVCGIKKSFGVANFRFLRTSFKMTMNFENEFQENFRFNYFSSFLFLLFSAADTSFSNSFISLACTVKTYVLICYNLSGYYRLFSSSLIGILAQSCMGVPL